MSSAETNDTQERRGSSAAFFFVRVRVTHAATPHVLYKMKGVHRMKSVITTAFAYLIRSAEPEDNPRETIHQDMIVRGFLPETTEILLDDASANKKDANELSRILAHHGIRVNQGPSCLINMALVVDNMRLVDAFKAANQRKDKKAAEAAKKKLKDAGILDVKDINKIVEDIRETRKQTGRLQKDKRNHAPSPHRSLDHEVLPTEEELDLQEEAGPGKSEEEELDLLAVGE